MSSPARTLLPDGADSPPQSLGAPEARTADTVGIDPSRDFAFLNQGGVLSAMAKLVMDSVGASGIAIAYAEEGSVVCRASCGEIAPAVGTPLNLNSGIGAQCLREGSTVMCADTESDPRVNKAVCRKIGVRSILAVPLRLHSRVVGIAQAFYAEPNGFTSVNILELEHSAHLFVSSLPMGADVQESAPIPSASQPTLPGQALQGSIIGVPQATSPACTQAISAEALPAPDLAENSPLPVLDEKLPSSLVKISGPEEEAATRPLVESTPTSSEQGPAVSVSLSNERSNKNFLGRFADEPAFASFVQIEQQVWWKRSTLSAVALSTVLALAWIITHSSSHPLVPFKRANPSSALEKPEIEISSLPFAQLQNQARSGDSKAQFTLAKRYETGKGVGRNLAKAYSWYIVAAEGGNDAARQAIRPLTSKLTAAQIASVRFEVARMYAKGIGVRTRDPVAAYAWMVLAEAAGNRQAKAEQNVLAASMRPQEIAEAQTRASYWLKSRGYSTQ